MRARFTRLLAVTLTALALGAVALADRETSQFHASRADKLLTGKKWDEAAGLYRKSLEEDDTYLPARFGLAQALVGAGNSAAGLVELRGFVESARAADPLPPEWKPILAKAEKQLNDLDAAGQALQKILVGYADDVAALAERWATKDPGFAERAARRALKVKPGHAKAMQVLEKMGKSSAGETIDLFNGKNLAGWVFANPPTWQVIDGALVGDVPDAAMTIRSERIFEGDYDVRIEARRVEEYAGSKMFAVLPTWKKDRDYYELGILGRDAIWCEPNGPGKSRDIVTLETTKLKKPFDPAAWNVFELRFRGKTVTALVNDEVIGDEPRPENRKGGFVGLLVQDLKVAFRKVQVEVR
ncbi:MAG: DUF1080 domain-containing protein [Planctomycetes bacterium]|nr:DUF1080 domain-containing protein [Planctomycetota bacterium]